MRKMTPVQRETAKRLDTNIDAIALVTRTLADGNNAYHAVETLTAIMTLADLALRDSVTIAREVDGKTWQQIGDMLGTTRQAAQMRFGGSAEDT